jgi:lysophospholipase L1-like esterase
VTIVVAEGDSISVDYGGYYAGYYKLQHPELEYHNLAVGGSGLNTMAKRQEAVQELNPDIVTVFIGANDLGSAPSAQDYFDRLVAYAAPIRARGSKVWIATNLPINFPGNATYTNKHNALRGPVADLLKQAIGKQIDGVIDFGGDPVMGQLTAPMNGQLYHDGVHPTERGFHGGMGGHDYLYAIYEQTMKQALKELDDR